MMRSLFSGISGLRVHQTKMDVIANNISNVNTVGFKSSRVTFNEVFTQTLAGAAGPDPGVGRGGTNPMQIGLGANVASIDMLMTTGAAQRTDNPFDVMIQGDSFFVVKNGGAEYFTRAGAFRLDEIGQLTMPGGPLVQGWKIEETVENGKLVSKPDKSAYKDVVIDEKMQSVDAKRTSAVDYAGNMNALEDGVEGITNKISFFDSLGDKYSIDVRYTYDSVNKNWNVEFGDRMYPDGDTSRPVFVKITEAAAGGGNVPAVGTVVGLNILTTATPAGFNPADPSNVDWTVNGKSAGATPTYAVSSKLAFKLDGHLNNNTAANTQTGDVAGGLTGFVINIDDVGGANVLSPLANFATDIKVSFDNVTQFNIKSNMLATATDGNKAGKLIGLSIGGDGVITGRYDNGKTKQLFQIVTATFANRAGLERVGNNLFVVTNNSGEANIGSVAAGGGSLLGGVLEMANVDLAGEFTEMITTQRGFQANSRVITTSDDMLQELVNLKR